MNKIAPFWVLPLLLIASYSCTNNDKITSGITLQGITKNFNGDTLYLYDVAHESYGYVAPIASIPISKEATFEYHNDTIASKLYCLSDKTIEEISGKGISDNFLFLLNGENKLEVTKMEDGRLVTSLIDSPIQERYNAYKAEERKLSNADALDSLYAAFYQARDAGEFDKFEEINAAIEPLYEQGEQQIAQWSDSLLQNNHYSLFDLYLFYSRVFQLNTYDTLEDIDQVREEVSKYDATAQESAYAREIEKSLKRQALSAIGMPAPDISGQTPTGETLKLSELKGSYVLVDFWSSGCSWCRLETPNLQEALKTYGDQGFTIIGVSSDFNKQDWLHAIEEDSTHDFKHIILSREARNKIFMDYNIIGIPQIILLSPEGTILARNLRGEEILQTISTYLTK